MNVWPVSKIRVDIFLLIDMLRKDLLTLASTEPDLLLKYVHDDVIHRLACLRFIRAESLNSYRSCVVQLATLQAFM